MSTFPTGENSPLTDLDGHVCLVSSDGDAHNYFGNAYNLSYGKQISPSIEGRNVASVTRSDGIVDINYYVDTDSYGCEDRRTGMKTLILDMYEEMETCVTIYGVRCLIPTEIVKIAAHGFG